LPARDVLPGQDPLLSWAFGPLGLSLRKIHVKSFSLKTCPSRS
jgi:hypothetical protein